MGMGLSGMPALAVVQAQGTGAGSTGAAERVLARAGLVEAGARAVEVTSGGALWLGTSRGVLRRGAVRLATSAGVGAVRR